MYSLVHVWEPADFLCKIFSGYLAQAQQHARLRVDEPMETRLYQDGLSVSRNLGWLDTLLSLHGITSLEFRRRRGLQLCDLDKA